MTTKELCERVRRESRFQLTEDALFRWAENGVMPDRRQGQGIPARWSDADASRAVKVALLRRAGQSLQQIRESFGLREPAQSSTVCQTSNTDNCERFDEAFVAAAARAMAETRAPNAVTAMEIVDRRRPGTIERLHRELAKGGSDAHEHLNNVWQVERRKNMTKFASEVFEIVRALRENIEQGTPFNESLVAHESIGDERTARERVADARRKHVAEMKLQGRTPIPWDGSLEGEWPRLFADLSPANARLIRAAEAELDPATFEARNARRILIARANDNG